MNSGSSSGSAEECCDCSSGSGVRSRSCTSWNAGRVARIAGVIIVGSVGSVLSIDCRICRDCCGGDAGGEFMGEDTGEMLNW